jgi:hypothetical protein
VGSDGWPTSKIRVPHLRDGLIVAKVGSLAGGPYRNLNPYLGWPIHAASLRGGDRGSMAFGEVEHP